MARPSPLASPWVLTDRGSRPAWSARNSRNHPGRSFCSAAGPTTATPSPMSVVRLARSPCWSCGGVATIRKRTAASSTLPALTDRPAIVDPKRPDYPPASWHRRWARRRPAIDRALARSIRLPSRSVAPPSVTTAWAIGPLRTARTSRSSLSTMGAISASVPPGGLSGPPPPPTEALTCGMLQRPARRSGSPGYSSSPQ
jgi:hypothetical protein